MPIVIHNKRKQKQRNKRLVFAKTNGKKLMSLYWWKFVESDVWSALGLFQRECQ